MDNLVDGDGDAAEVLRVTDALFGQYDATARPMVDELQRLIAPEDLAKAHFREGREDRTFCPEAREALKTLVSACSTYITPPGQKWMSLKSRLEHITPYSQRSAVSSWFSKVTTLLHNEFAESNFHPVVNSLFHDACLGGTAAVLIMGTEDEPLYFAHVPLGTFAIAEDNRMQVCTLARRFQFTAAQAVAEFGYDALSAEAKADYDDPVRRYKNKRDYVHLTRPRGEGMYRNALRDVPSELRRYEGLYVDEGARVLVKREGYFEFPYLVTRFERLGASPYGRPPGEKVLPVIKNLIKANRLVSAGFETQVFPRVFMLAGQKRQVGMSAGMVTTLSEREAQLNMPREWGTSSRPDTALAWLDRMEKHIRDAFCADQLLAITNRDSHKMTATEVDAVMDERVLSFAPSFVQFTYDFRSCIRRVLGILFRQNKLPREDMPSELFRVDAESKDVQMLNPNVCYLGKISQAYERVQRSGNRQVTDFILQYTQRSGDTRMLDVFKPEQALRHELEVSGCPVDVVMDDVELEQMRQRKEQERQAAAEQQDAAQAAEVMQRGGAAVAAMRRGGAAR